MLVGFLVRMGWVGCALLVRMGWGGYALFVMGHGWVAEELLAEYHDFFPRAAKAKAASPSFTNFEAWVAAIRRTQQHERTRASHPAQNIKAVVARLGCWSSSSSTVERSFEETSGLRGGQSEDEFVNREGDILIIKKDPLLDKDRIQFTIAFHHLKASTSVKHHESNANIKMYESNV